MKSQIIITVEHGDDTDELESFCSNLSEDNKFAYPDLTFLDWEVRVDR